MQIFGQSFWNSPFFRKIAVTFDGHPWSLVDIWLELSFVKVAENFLCFWERIECVKKMTWFISVNHNLWWMVVSNVSGSGRKWQTLAFVLLFKRIPQWPDFSAWPKNLSGPYTYSLLILAPVYMNRKQNSSGALGDLILRNF